MTLELLATIADHPGPLCLCTVMRVSGSAPRHAGSKMLVGPAGRILGSVGGGRGEALVLAACQEVLAPGVPPRVLDLDMQGLDIQGPHMVCGGRSRILVERLDGRQPYAQALDRLARGEAAVLVKALEGGGTAVADGSGAWVGEGLRAARPDVLQEVLDSGRAHLAEAEGLLYDPLRPPDKLLILGGGHVGQALAALAPTLGFQVTVGDDRPEYLAPARFPAAVATLGGTFTEIVGRYPFDPATFVVIVTRGHLADLECVRAVLRQPYRYAGFMGSRRKARLILEQVAAEGFDPAKVEALHAPIGLEIGAETPAELAVALAAELVAARRHPECLAATHQARKARRQHP